MRKFVKLMALSLALVFATTACSSGSTASTDSPSSSDSTSSSASAESASSGEVYTATMSTPVTEGGAEGLVIENFIDMVTERTNGQVVINAFYASTLGVQKDVSTAMANNEIELVLDGSLTDYFAPAYSFMYAPYLIRGVEHMEAILASPIADGYAADYAEDNIAMMAGFARGSRVTYATMEMTSADDFSNLVIRMPDLATYINAWTTLGASTQILGGGDVYSSLATGVINSCEGPYSQGASDKYAEVAPYLYATNHVTEYYFIYASQAWLDSLPADLAAIVEEAAADACVQANIDMAAAAEESLAAMEAIGAVLVEGVDYTPLYDSMAEYYAEAFETYGWTSSYDEIVALVP